MSLNFVKMQAQGNDFVIVDGLKTELPSFTEEMVKKLCDRRFGIGCDQLLLLKPHDKADALMVIYNADGSQAANCGNGLRCVGELLMRKEKTNEVKVALADRVVQISREGSSVQVRMGKALIEKVNADYTDVNIGNTHRVYFQNEQVTDDRNVEVVSEYDEQHAKIRIYERGAGETLACGSGACAVALSIWHKVGKSEPLTIEMPGGEVVVSLDNGVITLIGKVAFVYQGVYIY